jgi:hypothetical protein
MRRPWSARAIAAALAVSAAVGHAQERPAADGLVAGRSAADAHAAPPIELAVVGPGALPRLQAALAAVDRPIRWVALDAMDRSQVTRPPAQAQGARVWIDCTDATRIHLYFANWSTGRFLLREVPLAAGLDALGLETLAQMIESSLSALIADRSAGMDRAAMGRALGERPMPVVPPAAPPVDFGVGAFYAAQAFAAGWPVEHGPGLAIRALQGSGRARLGGWATAQYQLPEMIATDLAGVRLDTAAVRVGPELDLPISRGAALAVRAGAGGDVIQVASRQGTNGGAALVAARTYWDFMAQFAMGARLQLPARLELEAEALVDADFVLRHYDVNVDGHLIRIVTPWRVRPGIAVALSWH